MPQYRIYTVKPDGHLSGPPQVVECPSDQDAVKEAKRFLDGHLIEIWEGTRVVFRIDPAND
jgi:hypothetical protein